MSTVVTIIVIALTNLIRITHQQSYRNLFVYQEINLNPTSKRCDSVSLAGDADERVAAIHVVDQTPFDVPCYCMLYNAPGETITRINVKHQEPADSSDNWELEFSVTPSQWDNLGHDGLIFQVKQTSVELITESGPRNTSVAVAIEVEGGTAYMHLRCQDEVFTTSTTSTTTTTTETTTTTTTSEPSTTTTETSTTTTETTTTTEPTTTTTKPTTTEPTTTTTAEPTTTTTETTTITTTTTTPKPTTVPTTTESTGSTYTITDITTEAISMTTMVSVITPPKTISNTTSNETAEKTTEIKTAPLKERNISHVTILIIIGVVFGFCILVIISIGIILTVQPTRRRKKRSDEEQMIGSGDSEQRKFSGTSHCEDPGLNDGDSELNKAPGKHNVLASTLSNLSSSDSSTKLYNAEEIEINHHLPATPTQTYTNQTYEPESESLTLEDGNEDRDSSEEHHQTMDSGYDENHILNDSTEDAKTKTQAIIEPHPALVLNGFQSVHDTTAGSKEDNEPIRTSEFNTQDDTTVDNHVSQDIQQDATISKHMENEAAQSSPESSVNVQHSHTPDNSTVSEEDFKDNPTEATPVDLLESPSTWNPVRTSSKDSTNEITAEMPNSPFEDILKQIRMRGPSE